MTIIAGPNGAGKSTHSKELLVHLGVEAFDFDKEFYSIWSQFSFDPLVEQGSIDQAKQLYVDRKSEALRSLKDFAFETNYHTRQILSTIDVFKTHGYHLELVFIFLEIPEIAIERVKDRVAKGGHAVYESTIRERFANGLNLLNESFRRFDTVSIYLSEFQRIEALMILEPQLLKIELFAPIPEALVSPLPQLIEFTTRAS